MDVRSLALFMMSAVALCDCGCCTTRLSIERQERDARGSEKLAGAAKGAQVDFMLRTLALMFLLIVPATAEARHGSARRHTAPASKHASREQTVGAPWAGELRDATRLPDDERRYHLRRPWRAFGTRTTVAYVERAITDVRKSFPERHVIAIGDMSAKDGGRISGHRSHQSGRDIDIGLFYKSKPANYPRDFVVATAANLDCAATLALVRRFAETSDDGDGVQMMFLDFDVQGILYRWAREHGVNERTLDRLFQFPHGRGAAAGLVRHVPHHDDHLHVRFKCPVDASSCR